jgi:hypothetical protein
MKASIILINQIENDIICSTPFDTELEAQNEFDDLTTDWSEWEDKKFRLDLIVHHSIHGDLCRRSMFSNLTN